MNKKLTAVFLILTAVPVGLLGWLAVVGYRTEAERHQRQLEAVGKERLTTVNLQIEHYFGKLESKLLGLPNLYAVFTASDYAGSGDSASALAGVSGAGGKGGTEVLRELCRENFLFRQIFLLDSDNSVLYPSEEVPLSGNERDFLLRTKEIGLSRGLFFPRQTGAEGAGAENASSDYGWYTWYLGDGINFIFWRRYFPGGESRKSVVAGVELNRMAVISGIIRELPGTDPEGTDNFHVALKDVGSREVYIWGSYLPEEGGAPTAAAPVAPPLNSWRLEYYIPPGTEEASAGRIIPIFGVIGFVSLAIIGLAVYLYRESTREVREAYKKVSFVNQVSHELKTPLTNIRMYAELLESRFPEEDGTGGKYLDIVVSESRRLSRLIGNVLTFAREGRGGRDLAPSEEIPDRIVESVLGNFRASLKSKGIEVFPDLHAGGMVLIDRGITEQILSNLISNVEKYAAAGGYLGITTMQRGDASEIIVADKGPGIPVGLREKVFAPFFRISSRMTDGISGTGIGLSIVRSLAKKHGGNAAVLGGKRGGRDRNRAAETGTAVRVILKTPQGTEEENEDTVS